jgi:4Fe-4S binding domain
MTVQMSEKRMHSIRWVLAVLWLILIASLFSDPVSSTLTSITRPCVRVQAECLVEQPYQIGARIWWNYIIPTAVMILMLFGHEFWRRICPLYFFSQIPRALNFKAVLNIENNQWLIRNHLYLQFSLLFIGLVLRILFINSERVILGLFLLFTILSAIITVYIYGGRSWCHYICPFAPVQTALIGTRGLLENKSTQTQNNITQSMCRQTNPDGQEESTCTACKSTCKDINSEEAYWQELYQPGRKLIQYGYVGLVIGFFVYQVMYAGNFDYYYSGFWHHEPNQISKIWQPGFYILNQAIPIPKLIAAPLTLAAFVWLSYSTGRKLEKRYLTRVKLQNIIVGKRQVQHQAFSISSFIAFNLFFIYGGRGEILRLPFPLQLLFQGLVVLVSTSWLHQNWYRTFQDYEKEQENYNYVPLENQVINSLNNIAVAKGGNSPINHQHTLPRAVRVEITKNKRRGNTRIKTSLRAKPDDIDPNQTILSIKPKNVDSGKTIPRINPRQSQPDGNSQE